MKFHDFEFGLGTLAKKGKDGKITIEDMQGGTFTISNGGTFGSLMGTPIINPPQTAILGMHSIINRPVVRGE
jgi:2-oxoglutarate dehydrogenase E2 component (dihydrolipoamide succinyltransferase)